MSAYQHIAPYYSRLMSHVDYTMWASLLLTYLDTEEHAFDVCLELAGGDGRLADILKNYFPKYILTDLSEEMLKESSHLDKFVCDMRNITMENQSVDTVLSIYDSVNYLLSIEDLTIHFKEVARVLQKGGYYIFDTVTQLNCKTYFEDYLDFEEHEDADIVREGWYDADSAIQMTRFIVYKKLGENFQKIEETHEQRIWSEDELNTLIAAAGFSIQAKYCGFTNEIASAESERIHWVLKKL